jgi:hypothetical protein
MPGLYILDADGIPQPCADVLTWGDWMETHHPVHVVDDTGTGADGRLARVSTVFLGLDHNHADSGPPVLWETMVFGGALDGAQVRYTSHDEARDGHLAMCQRVYGRHEA